MIDIDANERRQAFVVWLRTSRLPTVSESGTELKFNPYHDPRNGQFTFAPGGPRSLGRVVASHRQKRYMLPARANQVARQKPTDTAPKERGLSTSPHSGAPAFTDAVYRPDDLAAASQQVGFVRPVRPARGSNSRAFEDPMLLHQVFPRLRDAPGGAIIAAVDNVFNFSRPAREAVGAYMLNKTNILLDQIKSIDPGYRFDSFGFPSTVQGQINQVNGLRFDRATALFRVKGEIRPMQVETMRFLQSQIDLAYERGLKLLRAGKQEALGNYIDWEVRRDLRYRYNQARINSAGVGPIRVNRRENETSENEITFRRPGARVGSIAYDVTLTRKTLKTPQIRGFFNTDFKPDYVIIIRPQRLGPDSSYIISRPEG